MYTTKILADLRAERDRLDKAIAALETLDGGTSAPPKRGRKPGKKTAIPATKSAKRVMSPEARKRIAAAQKKRWAAQKKAAKTAPAKEAPAKKAAKARA